MTISEGKKFFQKKLNENYSNDEINFYYKCILVERFNLFSTHISFRSFLGTQK